MEIRNYNQALDYLDSFITPIVFKKIENPAFDPLERMRLLLSLIGNPEQKFKSIVVSGTSGKGSTAYFTSHILKTAGYKTGLTISPHLQKVNERLQINGIEVSDDKFVELLNNILPAIEKMSFGSSSTSLTAGAQDKPSYFEILLAMTFLYFAKEKVDIAVVEVGLEGKYDATNVLLPLLVVLTNISLDHTQILGDTVEKIALEAVSAIKKLSPSQIVVSGVSQKSVLDIVKKRCGETNSKLLLLGKDFSFKEKSASLNGSVFNFYSSYQNDMYNLKLSMIGEFQLENSSMAIETVLNLKKFGFEVSEDAIRQALSTAFFPGRLEIINYTLDAKRYTLVLDGAHNPAKMQAFIKALKRLYPRHKKTFVVAFKEDKNIKEMLEEIILIADIIIFTKFSTKTDSKIKASMEMESIKYFVSGIKYKKRINIVYENNSRKALDKALAIQQFNNPAIIIVTGSLYLVGEVRGFLL